MRGWECLPFCLSWGCVYEDGGEACEGYGEVEGLKEVAGYMDIYRFAWGWGVLTMASFFLVYGRLNLSFFLHAWLCDFVS